MTALPVIGAFALALAFAIAKGILANEIQGRIDRRIERSVEATIASLPDALHAEYAEEWRAELAATISMPLTAATYARGLRRSARLLILEAARGDRTARGAGRRGRRAGRASLDIVSKPGAAAGHLRRLGRWEPPLLLLLVIVLLVVGSLLARALLGQTGVVGAVTAVIIVGTGVPVMLWTLWTLLRERRRKRASDY